ncbi:MAG: hypothetical protein U0271_04585 [Polyangiaceae bacterium]
MGSALLAMLAMPTASCLITSNPQFEDPPRTAPFFLVDRASPDPRQIIKLEATDAQLELSALFRSEDGQSLDSAGNREGVRVKLLVDYGQKGALGHPFRSQTEAPTVAAGSWDDPPREARATWTEDELHMGPGCHRLTMMISHAFDAGTGCPSTKGDYDVVTWTVVRCDESGCPEVDLLTGCPGITESCVDEGTAEPTEVP